MVTYTTNNQAELRSRFVELYGKSSDDFVVKGLFSFYLEDLVRPYQNVVFPERISTTAFTEHNPHLRLVRIIGIPIGEKNWWGSKPTPLSDPLQDKSIYRPTS